MDDDILQEFLAESWENLSRLDTEIVSLEQNPADQELLASIFRTIHTIKGTCGFLGLNGLGIVAHSAENVLGLMRNGTLAVTPPVISRILEAVDRIKELLQDLEATGEERDRDHSKLIEELDRLVEFPETSAESFQGLETPPSPMGSPSPPPAVSEEKLVGMPIQAPTVPDLLAAPSSETGSSREATSDSGSPSVPASTLTGAMPASEKPSNSPASLHSAHRSANEQNDGDPPSDKTSIADLSIRVDVHILDSLMNLVGELVLTRNQLLQQARNDEDSRFLTPIAQLNRVTTDLQEAVMQTRMQPIRNVWSRLPRLVRDLAQQTGKSIELEMSGAETELDRTVLDAIKDPLTHMVRNSADHGIESPDERISAGKPPVGRIRLNAYHEGGQVIICIEDDGAGIDTERVLQKAIEQQLVRAPEAENLTSSEILAFIFHPGFSTAREVSAVSGRGVGMDVVRTAIERIGGTIDIASARGSGTAVRIRIPLTLAIISALVVECGGECFAIPQLGVVELVRLGAEESQRIERIHDQEVFRLRDRLLPLIRLDRVLELDRGTASGTGLRDGEEREPDEVNIVVVQVGDDRFGLTVSKVFDTEEIVVKPVGSLLKDLAIYQGTTILGDGRVILILDVAGLAGELGNLPTSRPAEEASLLDNEADHPTGLLLFDDPGGNRMAVPLSLVSRLEEFPRSAIEQTGERLVCQYRGSLLPLLPIDGPAPSDSHPDPQPVLVFSDGGQSMGLMVHRIHDIVEEQLTIRLQSKRPGVLGTAIIDGAATDLIDMHHYLMRANPDWYARAEQPRRQHLLIVDDSPFFRHLLKTTLQSEGYEVSVAESAEKAIESIERGQRFDLIVSDLEMPSIDGYVFAQWLRGSEFTQSIPLLAVSSASGEWVEQRVHHAGFDRFLRKFDAEKFLQTVDQLCQQSEIKQGVGA